MIEQNKNFALLLGLGLDNGGANTLAVELSKELTRLGFKHTTYYITKKTFSSSNSDHQRTTETFVGIKDFTEIPITDFDYLFTITVPLPTDKKLYPQYIDFLTNCPAHKCLLMNDRRKSAVRGKYYTDEIYEHTDLIYTLLGEDSNDFKYVHNINPNIVSRDLNFYDWGKFYKIPFANKRTQMRLSFVGRFASCKGWQKIIKGRSELPKRFVYTLEGGYYKGDAETGFSTTIGILSVICSDIKKKTLHDGLFLHSNYDTYDDDIKTKGDIHIYPTYDRRDMMKRVRYALMTFYPYNIKKSTKHMYYNGIEYTVLESIKMGTPVLLSKEYGEDCHVNGIPLIEQDCGLAFYEKFSDIENVVREYCRNYDSNVEKMQKWFSENYTLQEKLDKIFYKLFL